MKKEATKIYFSEDTCRFEKKSKNSAKMPNLPLSVILQVTRKCNLSCVFCSETEKIPDPTIADLKKMRDNLIGVPRVFLSGGEPLLRKDFGSVLDIFSKRFIVGLPTNGTIIPKNLLNSLAKGVDFVNIGLDGPRNVTNKLRGHYDEIISGVQQFKRLSLPIALCGVVLSSTVDSVLLTCQIADTLEAKKLKLVLPILKGNALKLPKREYLEKEQTRLLAGKIKKAKEKYGWKTKITLTDWGPDIEGYSILVYPNGNTYAWPVYDQKEKVLFLGNLKKENIRGIWAKNPFKTNHFNKYLGEGKSMFVI